MTTIGVPKESKNREYRVGLTPASVRMLCVRGHRVLVEQGAGLGSGADDDAYRDAGATILGDAAAVFGASELIVKVKEPQPHERAWLGSGQVLFTYLHLASDPQQCADLMARGVVAIGYETVTQPGGGLPLLRPMSAIAGRLAVQAGAHHLERPHGGRGVLLDAVDGVPPGRVTILGAGTVGTAATRIACGMGARVRVLDRSPEALLRIHELFGEHVTSQLADAGAIEEILDDTDLLIGAVLIPGAAAPHLVTRAAIARMPRGAVAVDVSIDQGGCLETSRPTTHDDPVYECEGVVHYCVTNMPGAVPHTATLALNHATLPYVIALADKGWREALREDADFRNGLNVCLGKVCHPAAAASLGYVAADPLALLDSDNIGAR